MQHCLTAHGPPSLWEIPKDTPPTLVMVAFCLSIRPSSFDNNNQGPPSVSILLPAFPAWNQIGWHDQIPSRQVANQSNQDGRGEVVGLAASLNFFNLSILLSFNHLFLFFCINLYFLYSSLLFIFSRTILECVSRPSVFVAPFLISACSVCTLVQSGSAHTQATPPLARRSVANLKAFSISNITTMAFIRKR
jgi:hypothetical protein